MRSKKQSGWGGAEALEKFKRGEPFLFIGIDPGKTGAIAAISKRQEVTLLEDWPGDEFAAAEMIRNLKNQSLTPWQDCTAAIERAQSMPKQGVKSMFTYGTNYGIWRGILAALNIRFILPTPQAWQKGVLSKAEDKKPALAAARRMFPDADLVGPRGGGKHGRADALLIADWCRRQYI